MEKRDATITNSGRMARTCTTSGEAVVRWRSVWGFRALRTTTEISVNLMQSCSLVQTYSASLDHVRNVAGLILFWQTFIQIRCCSQAEETCSIKASWDMMITGTPYCCSPMPTPDVRRHGWSSLPKLKLLNSMILWFCDSVKGTVLWVKWKQVHTCRLPAKNCSLMATLAS